MIEFRAECGHTIRARSEDAGKMVNCAYCGKKALVPSDEADPMDSLLADTLDESLEEPQDLADRARPWSEGLGAAPLRIAWTAMFVVLVASVLVLTVRWVYREVTKKEQTPGTADTFVTREPVSPQPSPTLMVPDQEEPSQKEPASLSPQVPQRNLLADLDPDGGGVCVFSVPPGLEVYVDKLPVRDEASLGMDSFKGRTTTEKGLVVDLEPGRYRISVVAKIRNPDLMDYTDYPSKVRQVIARTGDEESAADAADAYFIVDGGDGWRVEKLRGQYHLIRFYEIELGKEWRPIYSLFVPDVACAELLNYVGGGPRFVFDRRLAEQELRFWNIPQEDFSKVMSVLSRIGKAVVTDRRAGTAKVLQVWPDKSVVGEELAADQLPPEP
jgi:hypothetical protein